MKSSVVIFFATLLLSNLAFAEPACDVKAAEKKLAGAAKTSFLNKCERDAQTASIQSSCDAKAAEKKLHGAAKSSFTRKCINDARK